MLVPYHSVVLYPGRRRRPHTTSASTGAAWWNALSDEDRALWLGRATLKTATGAYLAYLAYMNDQAWHDAAQEARRLARQPAG